MIFAGVTRSSPQNSQPSNPAPPVQTTGSGTIASNPQPTLRSSTHLVQVNVVVQDKKGNPVTDLSKSDFVILDQGKPQVISVFSPESTHLQPAPTTTAPTNIYSNRIEQEPGIPTSITVILVDALNTHFTDMAYAREHIAKFLKQLQPQDRVAIYGLTSKVTVIQDFTTDAASLLAALNRSHNVETPQISTSDLDASSTGTMQSISSDQSDQSSGDPSAALDSFFDTANQQLADFATNDRAITTAKAIEAIADHVAKLPGRKNLVWVSGGFPLELSLDEMNANSTTDQRSTNNYVVRDTRSFSDDVERAARALNNANMAIYPVDARGLFAVSGFSADSQGPPGGRGVPRVVVAAPPDHRIFDTMNVLADRTGGRAFYNTNDIQNAIRHAIDDTRFTYVLGYYPDHGQWNGQFHEIKIKLDRPGTNVRYRRGYFALSDSAPLDNKKRAQLLNDALSNSLDSTSLGITVQARPVDVPGAQILKTTMKVETGDFVLNPQGSDWIGDVDFFFVQVEDQGKFIRGENRNVEMKFSQQAYENIQKNGLILPWDVRIAPGAKAIRIIALDTVSGTTGSVTIPLGKLFPSLAVK